jgi:hypothetical protein
MSHGVFGLEGVTHLVRHETAAFWKAALVQTQVVSVLNHQWVHVGRHLRVTYMDEQPAVAAASVTHWRTQAVIPLIDEHYARLASGLLQLTTER